MEKGRVETCVYLNFEGDSEFECTCYDEKLESEPFDTGLSIQERPIAWKHCAFLLRGTATRNCYVEKD